MIGLNTTCDIYTLTGSTNQYGETIYSKTVLSTGTACRFIAGDYEDRLRLELEGGTEREVATHKVLFDPDVTVNEADWLYWDSRWYKVLASVDIDHWGHHLEVWAAHVQGVTGPG